MCSCGHGVEDHAMTVQLSDLKANIAATTATRTSWQSPAIRRWGCSRCDCSNFQIAVDNLLKEELLDGDSPA